ncbi:MAG: ABC transporter ATP-binding protein [Bacteroidetes bacterium]|nr:ABC transporter ATP-binding protein [Bacteroidota bacterium]
MIDIQHLTFHYGKRPALFDDFSLSIEQGKIVGLLGKNGAGKTTLLRLMAGLLKPQQGWLRVNGYQPFTRNPNFLEDVYMIPETFSLPSMSIAGYLKAITPLYRSFDREKLETVFESFELKTGDHLHRLSHGQQKKFLIAFALASNCKLLLLDEPTNGLDIPSKSLFRKVMVGSISDEQLVLISTHQVKDVDSIMDEVAVIDHGKMIFRDHCAGIGQKYEFETVLDLSHCSDAVYWESSPMGYRVVRPSKGEKETGIDWELLFNAIINHKMDAK